ncbi:MAG: hypothetical protein ABL876_07015, partial [Chitinophagaceae bacterium]
MSQEIHFTIADYTDNLLKDKLNLIVLAWIEKSGTASDVEILDEIGLTKEKLNSVLLKLYNNQLIEVKDSFYKISVKGKRVLDVSKISELVINDTCKIFETDLRKGLVLRDSFIHYRDSYYLDYLHTQNSLKLWNRILDSKNFKNAELSFKIWSKIIIILWDLSLI